MSVKIWWLSKYKTSISKETSTNSKKTQLFLRPNYQKMSACAGLRHYNRGKPTWGSTTVDGSTRGWVHTHVANAIIIIHRRASVRSLPLKTPDEEIGNRSALTETRIRRAEVEARESGALQGPHEGEEAPPQHDRAGPAEPWHPSAFNKIVLI